MNAMGATGMVAERVAAKINYTGLTALRGIAAVMVVLVHVWGIHQFELPFALSGIVPNFRLGVPLFFVISAFSLYVSTSPRLDQQGWLNDFLIRRFMRIAPLFYLASLLYLTLIPWLTGGPHQVEKFLLTLTFLFNFMPEHSDSNVWAGWSVGVEMIFYLILPPLLVAIRSLRAAAVLGFVLFVISSAFVSYYRHGDFPDSYEWFSFFSALGVFGAGIFGYFLFQRLRSVRQARSVGLGLLATTVVLGGLIIAFDSVLTAQPVTRALWWAYPFALLVVSQCLRPVAIITNRLFEHLGALSFSLYLLHPPIIFFSKPVYLWLYAKAGSAGAGYGLSVLFTLLLLYPAAEMAFRLIERPGIHLGEAWIRRRRDRSALAMTQPVV